LSYGGQTGEKREGGITLKDDRRVSRNSGEVRGAFSRDLKDAGASHLGDFAQISAAFRNGVLETGENFWRARTAKNRPWGDAAIISRGSEDRRRYTPSTIGQEVEMAKRREIGKHPGGGLSFN
jgi:predicted dehydrogenase